MKISIVIPAYNEEAIIEKNITELNKWCADKLCDYEIVVVSDGSTDRTHEIIEKKLSFDNIVDASYDKNRGKGGALKAGVIASSGDIIVTTDCDLAYGTEVIGEAVSYFEENKNCDILIGSRSISNNGFDGYPLIRKIASKVYFKLISLYSGIKVSDSQCGFKCYRKEAANALFSKLETTGFAFDLEILMRAFKKNYSVCELPVSIKVHNASKVSVIKDSVKMLNDIGKIKKICSAQ